MSRPLVSIIMSCFNGEKFVNESVGSIIDQTYENWELIFWDNNSTDKSKDLILSFKDLRIKYFKANEKTNLGISRSKAIKEAKGDLVAFLDVDDTWYKDKLDIAVKAFLKDSDLGVFFSNFFILQNNKKLKKKINKFVNSTNNLNNILNSYINNKQLIAFLTVVIKKKFLDLEPYYFDKNLHISADFDLIIRLAEKYKFKLENEPLGMYRRHNNNETSNSLEQQTNETLLCYEKFSKKSSIDPIILRKMKRNIDYNFAKIHIDKNQYNGFINKFKKINSLQHKIKLLIFLVLNFLKKIINI